MVESRHPNRWFGSNPQAIPNQGRRLSTWSREVPKDWRVALGADQTPSNAPEADDEGTGQEQASS
ncbi:MAG TPA: hypothetical protein VNT51_14430 [Miltoncostaeaceae bacterium]|nr:hypothetical protein [Miltoncostaeaceae bacterium]